MSPVIKLLCEPSNGTADKNIRGEKEALTLFPTLFFYLKTEVFMFCSRVMWKRYKQLILHVIQ